MRFRRWPRPTPFEDTTRKRAALARKQRLAREALPLFSIQIAIQQPAVDDVMHERAIDWMDAQRDRRKERAARWRDARHHLFALDGALRATVRTLWRSCPYPPDPSYFTDLLNQIAVGRLDPERPPWIFHQVVSARTTPNPTRFDEAFRKLGARKVGGGPKTTAADEFLFCGNLGAGMLFLRSRVRLIDPNESFYTCSNHRLRDSHVGRAGHWVEIEVRGACSDDDLAVIQRLARDADTRPVVIRRVATLVRRPGEGGRS
jgi:hypothetical protein